METVVDELAKRWRKRHQVKVIHPVLSGMATPGVAIERFTLQAWPQVSRFKPDIVIPANGGWQSLLMRLYCLASGAKLVISGQAGLGRDDRLNLLMRPDLFVALSKRNARWAQKHSWGQQKIVIIPNGVDLSKFNKLKRSAQIPQFAKKLDRLERPVVLCVAGPERYKRVRETMKAVAKLKQGSLLLACASELYDTLGKQLLGRRFYRDGFTHEQMPAVYQMADVFTLVSESTEAFGIAYLEAMACGLPVVATDDALRREIVGRAGVYVEDPDDSLAYAQALEKALKKNWGDLPRTQAKRFSWDNVAQRYEEEFNKVQS